MAAFAAMRSVHDITKAEGITSGVRDALAAMDLSAWPAQCTTGSLLLAPLLRIGLPEFTWRLCVGYCDSVSHCWIEGYRRNGRLELLVDVTAEQFGHHHPRVSVERDPGLYDLVGIITPKGEEHCRSVLDAHDEDHMGVMVTTGLGGVFRQLREQQYRARTTLFV